MSITYINQFAQNEGLVKNGICFVFVSNVMIKHRIIDPNKFLIELHKLLNMTSAFSSISGKKHFLGVRVAFFLELRDKSREDDPAMCVDLLTGSKW